MGDADGRIGRVHALTARSRRTVRIYAQVLLFYLDVHVFGFGDYGHGDRRGMDPAARFRSRVTLDAVNPAFVLQPAEHALALDLSNDFFGPADASRAHVEQCDLPAFFFSIAGIHAEKLGCKKTRLVSARAGADFKKDVFF